MKRKIPKSKAPDINREHAINHLNNSINSLSQWEQLCKQAFDEITAMCQYGTEIDIKLTIDEVRSEKTNNKQDLIRLEKAYRERFAV